MKTIKLRLSTDSINSAIDELKEYKKEINTKVEKGVSQLAMRGEEIQKQTISSLNMPYSVGDLLNGAGYIASKNKASVFNNCEHCAFVEFGTGPKGASAPYPVTIPTNWKYASGSHIGEYSINGVMKVGWFYMDDNGDMWFTEGMPSRPYMYWTSNEMRNIMTEVFIEAFR